MRDGLHLASLVLLLCVAGMYAGLRGSLIERRCSGMGVPPKESHRYGFYLGLALARAAEQSHTTCLSAILDLEDPAADANIADSSGLTGLAHVSQNGWFDMLERLLPRSDVQCESWSCQAPLCLASFNGHAQAVVALLHARSIVDAADKDGRSPLQQASLAGHLSVVRALLQMDASVTTAASEDGRTALHRASSRGHIDVVKELLAAGANRSAVDQWNHTAWDLALQNDHIDAATVVESFPQVARTRVEV